MVEPLRHRQTKEAATDMFYLTPPRHISTLPDESLRQIPYFAAFAEKRLRVTGIEGIVSPPNKMVRCGAAHDMQPIVALDLGRRFASEGDEQPAGAEIACRAVSLLVETAIDTRPTAVVGTDFLESCPVRELHENRRDIIRDIGQRQEWCLGGCPDMRPNQRNAEKPDFFHSPTL